MKKILFTVFTLISIYSYSKDVSTQDGDWETGTTWDKGVEPTTEDTLVISNGDTVTISSNLFYNTSVVILLDGGTLRFTGKLNLPTGSKVKSIGGYVISTGGGNSDKIKNDGNSVWSGNMGDYSGNFTIDELGVLPVSWGNVSLSVMDGTYVYVEWSTYTEINNDYFTIEYSYDLDNWTEGSKVDGVGNSTTHLNYDTKFTPNYNGHVYVRIKQTDFDGEFDYSKIYCVNYFYYEENHVVSHYLDVKGQKHFTQPIGLSVKVYKSGLTVKVFRE